MIEDYQLDLASFELWRNEEGTDNSFDLEHAKRMVPIVLHECVTEKQRDYIIKYYLEKMTIREIGEFYGVNNSTVSRTINRGLDNAYKYLRFVSPLFVNSSKRRGNISNGRKKTKRSDRIC